MNIRELFDDFLITNLELDDLQLDAVMKDRTPDRTAYRLLITAPAGSGKTRVLASRYLKLLVYGEKPENIVGITFTRKAAGEMKERIVDYLLEFKKVVIEKNSSCNFSLSLKDPDTLNRMILGMRISTIDSFLSSIIRLFPGESGVDPNFKVIDEIDEDELIDTVIDEIIEERMGHDKKIIELLRFFNFKYSTGKYAGFCLFNSIKRIVKNWEMYSKTIIELNQVTNEEFTKRIKYYIGNEMDLGKHHSNLLRRVKEFSAIYHEKNSSVNEFVKYILRTSVEDIYNDIDKFINYSDLFFTKEMNLRKRLKIKTIEVSTRELFYEISLLYEKCVQAILFTKDSDRSYLSSNLVNLIISIINKVEKGKRELGVLGIGDLKTITYKLLTKHKERFNILYNMDARVNHYLIDEFQDTDPIQWEIFQKLTEDWFAGETAKQERNITPTIFLVGDEKQSIYGFRNADVRIITRIKDKKNDPFTQVSSLVKNFRSKKEIVNSVNLLFKRKMKRLKKDDFSVAYEEMKPNDDKGGGIVKIIERELDKKKELRIPMLAKSVAKLILSLKKKYQSWGDIALLFRDSLNSHFYEEIFEKESIPYISSGGKSFFENREIREIIKILNFLENPYDDINFSSLFLSPIFNHDVSDLLNILINDNTPYDFRKTTSLYDKLKQNFTDKYCYFIDLTKTWLDKRDRISSIELIENALMDTNAFGILIDRIGGQKDVNIRKLLNIIERASQEKMNFSFFSDRLNRIIKAREKNADIDIGTKSFDEENTGAIHLMTVHKAKGLEFPVIIVPEVDSVVNKSKGEGIYVDNDNHILLFIKKYARMETPLMKKFKEHEMRRETEELKRLLYVALTRAKEELYLFISQKKYDDKRVWANIVYDSNFPLTDKLDIEIPTTEEIIISHRREHPVYEFSEAISRVPLKKKTVPSELGKKIVLYNIDNEKAEIKGTILHKLFELLGRGKIKKNIAGNTSEIVKKITHQMDNQFLCDKKICNEIEYEFLKVLRNKRIMEVITHKNSMNEFHCSVQLENEKGEIEIIPAVIDKIIFESDKILIFDYKTDTLMGITEKKFIESMKKRYKQQMEAYTLAVKMLFGKENVKTFLVLTSILEIVEV